MADLTITRQDVALSTSAVSFIRVQVAEAVTQGQPLYRAATNSKYYKAAATSATSAAATVVAMTPASAEGYCLAVKSGDVIIGATTTQGTTYVVSATAGGIAPHADLGSGNYVTTLGIAISATVIRLNIQASGIAIP